MAQLALRLEENVDGDFYVDSTCIDCDACRQIAPTVFHDIGEQSAVFHQPSSDEELLAAQKALLACPTSSIGDVARRDMTAALAAYPELVEDDVYRCGFTSESSFGAFSYLIRTDPRVIPSAVEGAPSVAPASSPLGRSLDFARDDTGRGGNILIDSPRFAGPIVKNIARMGGARRMLLTHQDDVADHQKFHERFGCERVLHRADVHARTSMIEVQPEGIDPIELEPGLLMIPTPGHTRGHAVFLWRDEFLFTGDHLAWSESRGHLYAFRGACWYSWTEQIRSMERLLAYRFEWVLPGHGRPIHLPAEEMERSLERCVQWMRAR